MQDGKMTVGIVGLGLIGGSAAKAYKGAGHRVLSHDTDINASYAASLSGASDGKLTENNLGECELVILCTPPEATVSYLRENASHFSPDTLVIDFCGIKRQICEVGFSLAEKHGFTFVGGHPMAGGKQKGMAASRADIFTGASMVIVPPVFDNMALLDRVKRALSPLSFEKFKVSTAEKHDRLIAYTSQLTHVISNALLKSSVAPESDGFYGGSLRNMTQIAKLNEKLWAELFLLNSDCLTEELDSFIEILKNYSDAIKSGDKEALTELLKDSEKQ